jgi:outer membrane biosynthesis protein TonB
MRFQFSLMVALALAPLLTSQEKPVTHCSASDAERVSQKTIKALIDKTEPIHPPCCAELLHNKGTLVLSIVVGSDGEVICVEYVSGHPLLIGVAIDSLRRWSFRPHAVKGQKRKFCGRIGLRYDANEGAVKYEVI